MKLRILAAVLAAVALLSAGLCAAPVLAAGTVTVSQVSGAKGDLVDVEISLTSDNVCSGNFNILYDSEALELVDTASTNLFHCLSNPYEEGSVRVSFMRVQPITDDLLCTLTFRVTADTSTEGSAVILEQVKLYDENGSMVESSVIQGAVARQTVHLRMRASDTAEHQAVRAVVELGGGILPAGGNFSISYDPACVAVKSVLPLETMSGVSFQYNIPEPGLVRVSFSGAETLKAGDLFAVVFQTVGSAGDSSELVLSDVKMYDENSVPMDVVVDNGLMNIVVPSEDAPKIWVAGGALQEDDTANIAVILQGRGYACGGNFVLRYDSSMTAAVTAGTGCEVNHDPAAGLVKVSWASSTPYSDELELLTIRFENAVESEIPVEDVVMYFDNSTAIPVVDIRPGRIKADEVISAVVDEVKKETTEDNETSYQVTVDVTDLNYLTEKAVEQIAAALALYENGRLVGIVMQMISVFNKGVNEIELTAATHSNVTDMNVFVMDSISSLLPLCDALNINAK